MAWDSPLGVGCPMWASRDWVGTAFPTDTHDRRLRDAQAELAEFAERFAPLRSRLGPCSGQLPATFGPDDLAVLLRFLDTVPRDFEWAVEVRHPGFHAGGDHERALNDALHAADENPRYWAPWVDRVVRWIGDGLRPLVFLHTPDNLVAPRLCQQFYDEVAGRVPIGTRPPPPDVVAPVGLFDGE